ncbi:piggyBac transposable element-derived protein 4-like [Pararge aegeria]|uniref:piggyBac transposable element-derived protein 4-like n=1 Tax=Pararge aegeria TaxID=116150 RepID=UPI0019CFC9B5|nr:piggyBac transposable element-derived protein 4-like [Pararge aegeria]XP_039752297.1 piggyBac transposable element-derived protein 4-like [Pararge aegeria]
MTDDDVPPELLQMVRDVIRRRHARMEGIDTRSRVRARVEELNEEQNSVSDDDDVFEDAFDGRGDSLLEGVDLHFEWSPMQTFRSVEESFVPEHTGSVESHLNPYNAFRSFWDDSILQVIVDDTNRNASRIQSATFQAGWHPTNIHELLCLFAFWMMTGVIRMPTIRRYFSSNSLLRTEAFSRITTPKRYDSLNRALHFVDTSPELSDPTNSGVAISDPMYSLRPIIDHLYNKFQSYYVLSKDICIDESLTLWIARLKFKQYIRSKAAKFGIKTFELCESSTVYLWSFLVYTGKLDAVQGGITKSTAIVLKLIRPLLNKGYRLFMDNWFNSPLLARICKRNGTDCVGTLLSSRVDVPRLVTHAPLKQGQLVARHSGDVYVLSWLDKKRVNMILTCHGSVPTCLALVSQLVPSNSSHSRSLTIIAAWAALI